MLEAVEKTARETTSKIEAINNLLEQTIEKAKARLPDRVYSKELIEVLFEQPYCKIKFLVEKGIAQRQTGADYLNELENIGILESKKSGREKLYLNTALYNLLSKERI